MPEETFTLGAEVGKLIVEQERVRKGMSAITAEIRILNAESTKGNKIAEAELNKRVAALGKLKLQQMQLTAEMKTMTQATYQSAQSFGQSKMMMTQLAFAADDFLTVFQQMGLAGGLRAAANNLSYMAAQIHPLLILLPAFATSIITMIPGLKTWGKSAKDAADGGLKDARDRLLEIEDAAMRAMKGEKLFAEWKTGQGFAKAEAEQTKIIEGKKEDRENAAWWRQWIRQTLQFVALGEAAEAGMKHFGILDDEAAKGAIAEEITKRKVMRNLEAQRKEGEKAGDAFGAAIGNLDVPELIKLRGEAGARQDLNAIAAKFGVEGFQAKEQVDAALKEGKVKGLGEQVKGAFADPRKQQLEDLAQQRDEIKARFDVLRVQRPQAARRLNREEQAEIAANEQKKLALEAQIKNAPPPPADVNKAVGLVEQILKELQIQNNNRAPNPQVMGGGN